MGLSIPADPENTELMSMDTAPAQGRRFTSFFRFQANLTFPEPQVPKNVRSDVPS